MKKGLVCMWGMNRYPLSILQEKIKSQFLGLELDFLISTWTDCVIDADFKYVIQHTSPTDEYLDELKFPYTLQLKGNKEWWPLRKGCYAQFFHNYKIVEFLKQNNIKYDVLIKTRTDLSFETEFDFNFDLDICYLPKIYWNSVGVGVNDHFICGKYSYLLKSLEIKNFEDFFKTIETSWNPETVHQSLLVNNNAECKEFSCNSYILLPDRKMK